MSAGFLFGSKRSVRARFAAVLIAGFIPAGCSSVSLDNPFGAPNPPPVPAPGPVAAPVVVRPAGPGETFGTGAVKVGLILPLTKDGAPSAIGQSLRNAAELAAEESGAGQVTVIVQDDRSTPDGAAAAAQAEIAAGAEIIVGPLYKESVRGVAQVARASGRPVIAFSTDASVASQGVYLLSLMIESYVDRIVDYAASKGKRAIGVLAPTTDSGSVAASEFEKAATRRGLRVVTVARYTQGAPGDAVKQIAAVAGEMDALFIADSGDSLTKTGEALTAAGVKVQLLGTGLWADSRLLKSPSLQGAWYAAAQNEGYLSFQQKYRAKYKSDPIRLATLSYDALNLVVALARTQGQLRYSEKVLTNSSGFAGADGLFRFRSDGPSERGLAVMQIGGGAASIVSAAPRSFPPS